MVGFSLLLMLLELTSGHFDDAKWKLALNIHASDGHNFGYGAEAWEDENDVGAHQTAFSGDYKSYDVMIETANFIAIVRHQNGVCEAVRVWEFKEVGKTLHSYFDRKQTSRSRATKDNHTYSYISQSMKHQEKDPIFAEDGGLVFNWWYSNNGVRIGNSNTWIQDGLPSKSSTTDNYHGLGNEFGLSTSTGAGSWHPAWWHDVSVHQANCHGSTCVVQGTDHGSSLKDGALYGQYAIYISDTATTFPCEDVNLEISMFELDISGFDRIDRFMQQGFLTYYEFVFDNADRNDDGFLSLQEYSLARSNNRYGQTITGSDVFIDFHRIDRDHDGLLNFDDLAFAVADTNSDGKLSLVEYSQSRVEKSL